MNVFTMPTIKSVSELDSNTQSVSVIFGLVDRTGQSFDYARDVNAVFDTNNNFDQMGTMQRCYQVLAGLITKCSSGVISKKQQDDYIAQQAAAKKAAEDAEMKRKADEEAQAAALKSAAEAAAKEAADTASSDQANATAAQSDATTTSATPAA
ncbi:uncharacterized protein ZMO1_ZMOp36x009 (plasmid) [Zymomonas mobilis subsp. mobilis ZM4 = ATCC 31821]|uniref:hypothetical protein n=1 Tax=Zymomonas mobilis TaxID=542 RepID=UPI000A8A7A48|nr:hypothetical protein [Zymomonas mobilis]AVZ26866.1 hypothetical protein ZMO2_ZMOp36x009 [Zymomonas mobilis subsp. mobilis]AVZ28785.1 hypothetical protein ZMO3_ZMOp41x009 [Zymomonas mobilis subsp. mobilis]AVZ43198.1 uncharacterized protein ZMO1_ZMOp36x009 [Zymomonas mobilis subsp. mobilis ZM4 = ATCC 31821]UBQ08676.1 hypothetical protein LB319_09395 [Zymomonas mobilis]